MFTFNYVAIQYNDFLMYYLIRDFKKSDVRKFDHLYLVKKNILIISIEEKMLKMMY